MTESPWIEAGAEAEFVATDRKTLDLSGQSILLIRAKGSYYAVSSICTHARAQMHDGDLDGFELECPLHGARFDIRTGKATPPASRALKTFEVRVEKGRIFIRN
ncbi:MAG: non-heme iron oxygenase ferredoxin subunit [Kiritimatiellia bacterium]|nr:non-heme iron oxygenase ferredoxin subunit [Kiritimatiellia bacterium]